MSCIPLFYNIFVHKSIQVCLSGVPFSLIRRHGRYFVMMGMMRDFFGIFIGEYELGSQILLLFRVYIDLRSQAQCPGRIKCFYDLHIFFRSSWNQRGSTTYYLIFFKQICLKNTFKSGYLAITACTHQHTDFLPSLYIHQIRKAVK